MSCMTSGLVRPWRRALIAVIAATIAVPNVQAFAQTVNSGSGGSAASIETAVGAFRATFGPLGTCGANGSCGPRREINWDGVPDGFASPNTLPANFFNVNSPRGVVFSTPGTGFAVSANAGLPTPILFGNIDPSYANTFQPFTAQRLFTAIGSNITDVSLFLPGTSTAAFTRGFGVVFSDVDLANTTSLQFFDSANSSLGTFFAPTGLFSFLGVTFASSVVSRVRIISGNTALGAGASDQNGSTRDVVVMDDFIYGEPEAVGTVVPEPSTYALMAAGLMTLGIIQRRRHGRSSRQSRGA